MLSRSAPLFAACLLPAVVAPAQDADCPHTTARGVAAATRFFGGITCSAPLITTIGGVEVTLPNCPQYRVDMPAHGERTYGARRRAYVARVLSVTRIDLRCADHRPPTGERFETCEESLPLVIGLVDDYDSAPCLVRAKT